jgi:hypothetical protein
MRIGLFFIFVLTLLPEFTAAQQYFPIKMNKKWGLMDADGRIVLEPVYDAIGEFQTNGYAVMQRHGKVGLLGLEGQEVIGPKYEDLKVLNRNLISVMEYGVWKIINMDGQVILPPGYEHLQVLSAHLLAFRRGGKWGVVDDQGETIVNTYYDQIRLVDHQFFQVRLDDFFGLLSAEGEIVVPAQYDEIKILQPHLILFKKFNRWGLTNGKDNGVIAPQYDFFSPLSDRFIRLWQDDQLFLYAVDMHRVLTRGEYDQFYTLSDQYIMTKRNRLLGLMDHSGKIILRPHYNEIQLFGKDKFRVNFQGKWGLVNANDQMVLPFQYDYIAPLKGPVSVVILNRKLGVVNQEGELVVPPDYERIVPENRRIKAYKGEEISVTYIDEEGHKVEEASFDNYVSIQIGKKQKGNPFSWLEGESQYVLDQFEWFYFSETDKWGLRRLGDGTIQIEPTFDHVEVYPDLGFSLVSIDQPKMHDFERTSYRFESVFGLVNNEVGLLVTDLDFWDIRLDDFQQGRPLARCIFSNGRHGLVSRIGKIIRRDFAYIGEFHDGLARVSIRGRLSGSMSKDADGLELLNGYLEDCYSNNYMLDFTQYDQQFETEAKLICEGCEWGYIDTAGLMAVSPAFTFAKDFVNEVGIVACGDKWGMVNHEGKELIPCRYDEISFLENTNNKIIRIFKSSEKYGLIDTLGQLAVNLAYDEIGSFSEGRLAVKRNGMWGFVDVNGLEVIPCRFRDVGNFSEGLAHVKIGRSWGFIDKQGNVEIDFRFTRVGNFQNGMAWFVKDGKYGYIDKDGTIRIEPVFEKAHDFEGYVARVQKDFKYGLIDGSGKLILRPKYFQIFPFDNHGLARVSYGDRISYGLINQRGEMITTHNYREIRSFQEGMAAVKHRDKYGYIDLTGKVIVPCQYSKASDFSNGRAAVQREGQCGYINKTGRELVRLEFSTCLDYEDGLAVVYKNKRKAGLIDSLGQFLIEPSINRLFDFSEGRGLVRDANYRFYYITEQASLYDGYYQGASPFQHGVAVVQSNGRWGVINQKGIELIPPKYDKIEAFENGYAKVQIKGFNGLTNLKGELIVQPDYEYISYAGEGLFRVEQGDKIGYFDMGGRWVWGLQE